MSESAPRFTFSLWRVMESIFWASMGLAIVQVLLAVGDEDWFRNSLLVFAAIIPGPAFGMAAGAVFVPDRRPVSEQLALRLLASVIGSIAWLVTLGAWLPV